MNTKGLSLKQQILIAALECSGGDSQKTFTMEDLAVSAWKRDMQDWGLRGYEDLYPDLDKMNKEISPRGKGIKGMIDLGFLERVNRRIYRFTSAGLVAASKLQPSNAIAREKADRGLETAVKQIIENPVFKNWLTDPARPKYFREAGHFWGIAPGTPPKTVRERVNSVEHTLKAAVEVLEDRGVEEIVEQRGRVLFDREDIERCLEFQKILKQRFAWDLRMLDPEIEI